MKNSDDVWTYAGYGIGSALVCWLLGASLEAWLLTIIIGILLVIEEHVDTYVTMYKEYKVHLDAMIHKDSNDKR